MIDEFKELLDEELGIDDDITEETDLRDDLAIDSLGASQLALALEEKYDIEIKQEELAELKTVGDCLELLQKHGVKDGSDKND